MNGVNDTRLLNIGQYIRDGWGIRRANYMMIKWALGGDKRVTDPVVYDLIAVPETYSSWGIKKQVSSATLLAARTLIFMYCMLGRPSNTASAGGVKGFKRVDLEKIRAERKTVIKKSETQLRAMIGDMFRRIQRPVPPEEVGKKYWQQLGQTLNLNDMPALENFDAFNDDNLVQRALKAFATATQALPAVILKCKQQHPDQLYLNAFKRNFGAAAKMSQVLPNLEKLAQAMAGDNWILHLGSHAVVDKDGEFNARAAVKTKHQNKAMIRRIYLGTEYVQSNILSKEEIDEHAAALETDRYFFNHPERDGERRNRAITNLKKEKETGLYRTIIHEGTHLVFNTRDVAYKRNATKLAAGELTIGDAIKGKTKPERLAYLSQMNKEPEWQRLGANKRKPETIIPPGLSLKNADSYAFFCASFFRLASLSAGDFQKEQSSGRRRGVKHGWDSWK